jgi:hypothetical protein
MFLIAAGVDSDQTFREGSACLVECIKQASSEPLSAIGSSRGPSCCVPSGLLNHSGGRIDRELQCFAESSGLVQSRGRAFKRDERQARRDCAFPANGTFALGTSRQRAPDRDH